MLSHDRVGVASGFCYICSFILFAHTIPSEISLARSILATRHWRFSALLPKTGRRRHDEQTLCRRTSRAPTKQASPLAHQLSLGHLLPSEGARAACRSCHVARPPPARFRGRGPDARIVCFFSARLLVGSRSLRRRRRAPRVLDDRFRGAVSRVVLVTTEIRRFPRGEGRFAGGDGARSPAARADYPARATAFSIAPRRSRAGSAIRLLSASCRGDRELTRVGRVDFGGRVRGLEDEDSSRRSNANGGRPVPPRARRDAEIIFSLCKISGTRRELSFLFFTGRCPFSVRSHLARGSFSEILSRPIDRAR